MLEVSEVKKAYGPNLADAVAPMAALVAFALLFAGVAVARFPWDG